MQNAKRMHVVAVSMIALMAALSFPFQAEDVSAEDYGFYVYGDVRNPDGSPPASMYVAITNERTNETIYDVSHTGSYGKDLSEFPSGYAVDDSIIIEAVDNNASGLVNIGNESFIVPPGSNQMMVGVGLAISPRTAVNEEQPPNPFGPEVLDGGREPPHRDLRGGAYDGTSSQSGKSGDGPRLGDNCNAPTDPRAPWTVAVGQDITCVDRTINRKNHLNVYGRLTLVSVDMNVDPFQLQMKSILTVYAGGELTVTDNANGGSLIQQWTTYYGYELHVYGRLHVAASTVKRVYGNPTVDAGGIVFHAGSHGLIERGSEISYGYTHGIYAVDVVDLTISNSRIVHNGQSPGEVGHGIFLDRSYALVTSDSDISDNDESGIYVRDTGTTRSCYGQPYNYAEGTMVAYWIWCDDGVWRIRGTTDGASHTFHVVSDYANNGHLDRTETGTFVNFDLTTGSPWMTFQILEIDGSPASTDQVFAGLAADHPASIPFTLYRTTQPLIRESTIANNDDGVVGENSAPTIVGNTISSNLGHGVHMFDSSHGVVADNAIDESTNGVFVDTTQYNLVKGNTITGCANGVYVLYGGGHVITGNDFSDNGGASGGYGLYFYDVAGSDVYVTGNSVSGYRGMDLRFSPSVVVEGNTVTGSATSDYGIGIRSTYTVATLERPIVRDNTISDFRGTEYPANGVGVYVYPHANEYGINVGATPLIEDNDISENNYGILSSMSAPTVRANTVDWNTWGIYIAGHFSNDFVNPPQVYEAKVVSSTFWSNFATEGNEGAGIWIAESPSSPVIGSELPPNVIYGNRIGIGISGGATPTVEDNAIFFNLLHGIYVARAAPVLQSNQIVSNTQSGVCLFGPPPSGQTIMRDNHIDSNRMYGVYIWQSNPILEGSSRGAQTIRENPLANIFLGFANPTIRRNLIASSLVPPWPFRPISEVGLEITSYSQPDVEENDFGLARIAGILIRGGSTPLIRNDNRITIQSSWWRESVGVKAVDDSAPVIGEPGNGNTIAAPFAGVYVGNVYGAAWTIVAGNTIGSGGSWILMPRYGIYADNAPGPNTVHIVGNTVSFNWIGICDYHSASVIRGNTVTYSGAGMFAGDGILLTWSTSTVGGTGPDRNTIESNGGWGIHMVYDAASNAGLKGGLLIAQNDVDETNGLGRILQEWRLRVQVLRGGVPQRDATVHVHDVGTGGSDWEWYPAGYFTTDWSGTTAWITVREYYWDDTDPPGILWDREDHRFCAEWGAYQGYEDGTITGNVEDPIVVTIQLGGSCPLG